MEEVADDGHEQRLQPSRREVVQEQEAAGGRSAAEGEAIMRKDMEGKKKKNRKGKVLSIFYLFLCILNNFAKYFSK